MLLTLTKRWNHLQKFKKKKNLSAWDLPWFGGLGFPQGEAQAQVLIQNLPRESEAKCSPGGQPVLGNMPVT